MIISHTVLAVLIALLGLSTGAAFATNDFLAQEAQSQTALSLYSSNAILAADDSASSKGMSRGGNGAVGGNDNNGSRPGGQNTGGSSGNREPKSSPSGGGNSRPSGTGGSGSPSYNARETPAYNGPSATPRSGTGGSGSPTYNARETPAYSGPSSGTGGDPREEQRQEQAAQRTQKYVNDLRNYNLDRGSTSEEIQAAKDAVTARLEQQTQKTPPVVPGMAAYKLSPRQGTDTYTNAISNFADTDLLKNKEGEKILTEFQEYAQKEWITPDDIGAARGSAPGMGQYNIGPHQGTTFGTNVMSDVMAEKERREAFGEEFDEQPRVFNQLKYASGEVWKMPGDDQRPRDLTELADEADALDGRGDWNTHALPLGTLSGKMPEYNPDLRGQITSVDDLGNRYYNPAAEMPVASGRVIDREDLRNAQTTYQMDDQGRRYSQAEVKLESLVKQLERSLAQHRAQKGNLSEGGTSNAPTVSRQPPR